MSKKKPLTYKEAGVNIDAGDAFVDDLKKINPSIGGFGGFLALPKKYKNPRLVLSTDGVGTKLLVAEELRRFDTIGIDLVAMVVNDIVVSGAEPLAFLDYYATEKLEKRQSRDVMRGIVAGCDQAGCELSGGETAELPGIYPKGGFDLAGFGVGVVEKGEAIDGSKIKAGDVVLGLASSGLHSNGYSLARRVVGDKRRVRGRGRTRLLEQLLVPTQIYVKPLLKLAGKVPVHGMAHITGGGIAGNLARILPQGTRAVIDRSAWEPHDIFEEIQDRGPVGREEMFRTFNMGIGMCVVVPQKEARKALTSLRRQKMNAVEIGIIEKGKNEVVLVN